MARTQINLSFPRSRAALYNCLLGKSSAIIEAAFIFYQPIALIELNASKANVDEAIDESVIKLRSHIELLEAKRRRYTGSIVITDPSSISEALSDKDDNDPDVANSNKEELWDS
jgi:hypothetical protein